MKRSLFFSQYLLRNTVSCCGNFRSCTSVYTPSSFPRTPCLARIYCAKISLHNLVLARADRLRISLSGLRSPSGFAVISTVASVTSETEKSPRLLFRYTITSFSRKTVVFARKRSRRRKRLTRQIYLPCCKRRLAATRRGGHTRERVVGEGDIQNLPAITAKQVFVCKIM